MDPLRLLRRPVAHLLEQTRPKPAARYLVFHTLDEKWERPGHGNYYEVIDLETARTPQVIRGTK
jgi:methionine sulfoxide reductase catalytic subunit